MACMRSFGTSIACQKNNLPALLSYCQRSLALSAHGSDFPSLFAKGSLRVRGFSAALRPCISERLCLCSGLQAFLQPFCHLQCYCSSASWAAALCFGQQRLFGLLPSTGGEVSLERSFIPFFLDECLAVRVYSRLPECCFGRHCKLLHCLHRQSSSSDYLISECSEWP